MKVKKIVFLIFLIIWMLTIFAFSNQPSEETSVTSGKTIRAILNLLPSFNQMEETEQEELIETLQPITRKLAHFSIYTLGGIIIALNINEYALTEKNKFTFSCLIGSIYSITDELHQAFVPGRACMVIDVIIDTIGVIFGVALLWIAMKIKEKSKKGRPKLKKTYKVIKTILDRTLALIGLIILLPFFLIFAIIIKLESKGPVFFKQKRVGKNKKLFYIYKFRSMRTDTPKDMPTHMLKDAKNYITKFGGLMRKTSIDELPQIINILKGEMSIIGPRPALWNQEDLIEERDKYNANDVMPGLTGWAQVNGRDELEISVKAKLDGEYVEKMSLWFDIKIFFKTIINVFKHEGVVEGAQEENKKGE